MTAASNYQDQENAELQAKSFIETVKYKARGAGAAIGVLERVQKKHPGNPKGQLADFFAEFVLKSGTGRSRPVSEATSTTYANALMGMLDELRAERANIQNLNEIGKAHARLLIARWVRMGLSTGTLQNRISILRRFLNFAGKGSLLPKGELLKAWMIHNGIQPLEKRSIVARQSKAWDANQVDTMEIIRRVEADCAITSIQLEMQAAFGLRVKESIQIIPAICDHGDHISVVHGTKGGLPRTVTFDDDIGVAAWQRDVLERAKLYAARHRRGTLSIPGYTLARSRERFYWICRKHGITKAKMGVTAHGLRHQFAARRYRQMTGMEPPVIAAPSQQSAKLAMRTTVPAAYPGQRLDGTGSGGMDSRAFVQAEESRSLAGAHTADREPHVVPVVVRGRHGLPLPDVSSLSNGWSREQAGHRTSPGAIDSDEIARAQDTLRKLAAAAYNASADKRFERTREQFAQGNLQFSGVAGDTPAGEASINPALDAAVQALRLLDHFQQQIQDAAKPGRQDENSGLRDGPVTGTQDSFPDADATGSVFEQGDLFAGFGSAQDAVQDLGLGAGFEQVRPARNGTSLSTDGMEGVGLEHAGDAPTRSDADQGEVPSPRELDLAARQAISRELGHFRPTITQAYVGSIPMAEREKTRVIKEWMARTEDNPAFVQALLKADVRRAWLGGGMAAGIKMPAHEKLQLIISPVPEGGAKAGARGGSGRDRHQPLDEQHLARLRAALASSLGMGVELHQHTGRGEPDGAVALDLEKHLVRPPAKV